MSVCRTCLSVSVEKDVKDLEISGKSDCYKAVFLFCFDIQIAPEDNISTKLCERCFTNILLFYDFKIQAQKNDIYWKSLEYENKNDSNSILHNEIKNEEPFNDNFISNDNFVSVDSNNDKEFIEEFTVKIEDVKYCESDDELLSVIKSIKYEGSEETKENKPVKKKYKKKGRPKKCQEPVEQVCEECGKTVRNLKDHMHQHLPLSERKTLKCKICDKTFCSHSARSKHYRIKHLGIKKKCKICGKEVVSIWSHQMKMHAPAQLPHECAVCARRFISRSVLAAHAAAHSALRAFPCGLCDKAFRTKVVMTQHRRQVHDKEKSHLCQICSKSFFKKYHLQMHLRSHTKERPYECKVCGKFFCSTTTLRNHQLVHSELKAFQCTLCDMSFRSPRYLKVHLASHSKIKKHPCKYCGVKFGRSDHKRRHERTAHERHLFAAAP